MPEIQLTPKERQALKARAHSLKPVVLLGTAGLTPSVINEIDRALTAHALIKVKVPVDDRSERADIFATVADRLSAARVQAIGKLLVLFRPLPQADTDGAADPSTRRPNPRQAPPAASARTPSRAAANRTRTTATRNEVERVRRAPAPRRDPGSARRAQGRTNQPAKRGRRGG